MVLPSHLALRLGWSVSEPLHGVKEVGDMSYPSNPKRGAAVKECSADWVVPPGLLGTLLPPLPFSMVLNVTHCPLKTWGHWQD